MATREGKNKEMHEDVLFKKWSDGTVSIQIIKKNDNTKYYLRKMTQTSDFDLSSEPYHYGNYTTAVNKLSEYIKKNNLF